MHIMDIFYIIVAPVQVKILIFALLIGFLIDIVKHFKRRHNVLYKLKRCLRALTVKILPSGTFDDGVTSRLICKNAIVLEIR
jgi:hypothetical protein